MTPTARRKKRLLGFGLAVVLSAAAALLCVGCAGFFGIMGLGGLLYDDTADKRTDAWLTAISRRDGAAVTTLACTPSRGAVTSDKVTDFLNRFPHFDDWRKKYAKNHKGTGRRFPDGYHHIFVPYELHDHGEVVQEYMVDLALERDGWRPCGGWQ